MAITNRVKQELFDQAKRPIRINPHQAHSSTLHRSNGLRKGKPWTVNEHERFLEALTLFPNGPWKTIAAHVGTRSCRQTMTHAQKYRQKIARWQKLKAGLVSPPDTHDEEKQGEQIFEDKAEVLRQSNDENERKHTAGVLEKKDYEPIHIRGRLEKPSLIGQEEPSSHPDFREPTEQHVMSRLSYQEEHWTQPMMAIDDLKPIQCAASFSSTSTNSGYIPPLQRTASMDVIDSILSTWDLASNELPDFLS